MGTHSSRLLVWVSFVAACASTEPQPSASPSAADEATTASTGGEATGEAVALQPAALAGVWAEFWSVQGDARTAQHAFAPDGRWSWRAAADVASGVVRRDGRWTLEGDVLRLRVEVEHELASCPTGQCASAPPRRIAREPAIEEALALGNCPPNDEARALDARYECRSLDGRAHWRRADGDPSALVDATP